MAGRWCWTIGQKFAVFSQSKSGPPLQHKWIDGEAVRCGKLLNYVCIFNCINIKGLPSGAGGGARYFGEFEAPMNRWCALGPVTAHPPHPRRTNNFVIWINMHKNWTTMKFPPFHTPTQYTKQTHSTRSWRAAAALHSCDPDAGWWWCSEMPARVTSASYAMVTRL